MLQSGHRSTASCQADGRIDYLKGVTSLTCWRRGRYVQQNCKVAFAVLIEIGRAWKVAVQDDLLHKMRQPIEQKVHAQTKIVEKIIASPCEKP